MASEEQAARLARYLVVPRTLTLARRGDSYLLIHAALTKRLWPGLYNGVGGHVERGEDVLEAAKREFREETGLEADLWLCGTVLVNAGETGVGLYVFTGEVKGGSLRVSVEGAPEWVSLERLGLIPAVSDLGAILSRIRSMKKGDAPFSGRSFYDQEGALKIVIRA